MQRKHPTFDVEFISFQRLHQLRQVCCSYFRARFAELSVSLLVTTRKHCR
jgi:hypothetical protein